MWALSVLSSHPPFHRTRRWPNRSPPSWAWRTLQSKEHNGTSRRFRRIMGRWTSNLPPGSLVLWRIHNAGILCSCRVPVARSTSEGWVFVVHWSVTLTLRSTRGLSVHSRTRLGWIRRPLGTELSIYFGIYCIEFRRPTASWTESRMGRTVCRQPIARMCLNPTRMYYLRTRSSNDFATGVSKALDWKLLKCTTGCMIQLLLPSNRL